MNALKLYGGARSRAAIVRWYLEEFAIPYEFVLLDMANGEHREPDFLSLNPFGKVPVLVDGDFALWESGAILLYLADKYGQMPNDPQQRAIYTQWVLFANCTLITGLFIEATREQETKKLLPPLDRLFQQQPFVMGQEFTVVDVAIGSALAYAAMMVKTDLTPYPHVADYIKRLNERPAFSRSIGVPAS